MTFIIRGGSKVMTVGKKPAPQRGPMPEDDCCCVSR